MSLPPPPANAPPTTPPRRDAGLPVQLSSLVGRDGETDEVLRLLEATRLLTLTGAGGSGKTRLAVEAAGRLAAGGHAVAWVELAPLGNPDLLARRVGAALSLPDEGDGVDALVRALGGAPSLLALDNCEHLVDACAHLAEALLRACPGLSILATSREALAVPGERAWLVPPLSVPAERHVRGDDVAASTAAQLFVARARDAAADFRLTDDNAAAVAEVCRRLDGLPLALELAASWVRVLSPQQIADRLGDALRLLTGGRRTAVPRQQTLRAALDWSYGLLSDAERRLLQRFSVFAGTFAVEAAEAVCGVDGGEVLDLLSSLVDKSLVVMQERDGVARYRLQEIVRQFAAERLREAGETAAVHERHLRHFLHLAEALAPRVLSQRDQAAVDRVEEAHDDLRAALRWTLEKGEAESAVRLALPLSGFWTTRGSRGEGEYWLREVRAAGPPADPALRARLGFALGTAIFIRAGWEDAEPLFRECLALYRALGDRVMVARTLARLSSIASYRGDAAEAQRCIEESWTAIQETGDRVRMAEVLNTRGRVAQGRGDLAAAAESFTLGVALARESGDPSVDAILSNLGVVALETGDVERARALFLESVTCAQRNGRGRYLVYPLSSLACVLVRQGQAERAAPLFAAVEALFAGYATHLYPRDRPRYDAAMAEARARLAPGAWESAWERGRGMTQDEAARYAAEVAGAVVAPPEMAGSEPKPPSADLPPDATEEGLRVCGLGGFRVLRGGTPMDAAEWSHARPRELFLYLLCHPAGRTREQIGLVFWPDASAAQVKNSFHVALHRLRRTAGHAELVVLENGRYRVNPALAVTFDAADFERDVAAALRALRAGADAEAALEAAVSLYGGDFLEGEPAGDWHLEFHDRLRRLYTDGLSALADARAARGDHEGAARALERLVRREELDEDAHRRLMRALVHTGRRDRALRQFERLAALLRRELDADPGPDTLALAREIRDAAATPAG